MLYLNLEAKANSIKFNTIYKLICRRLQYKSVSSAIQCTYISKSETVNIKTKKNEYEYGTSMCRLDRLSIYIGTLKRTDYRNLVFNILRDLAVIIN